MTIEAGLQCPRCRGVEVRPSRVNPHYSVCEECLWDGTDPTPVLIEMGRYGVEKVTTEDGDPLWFYVLNPPGDHRVFATTEYRLASRLGYPQGPVPIGELP